MALIDTNSTLGAIFGYMTQNVTGSSALTLLLIIILVMAVFIGLGLPVELSMVFILPLIIFSWVFSANYGGTGVLAAVVGIVLLYLVFIFIKRNPLNQ